LRRLERAELEAIMSKRALQDAVDRVRRNLVERGFAAGESSPGEVEKTHTDGWICIVREIGKGQIELWFDA